MCLSAPACGAEVPSSISGRAARSLPHLIYIIPFFLPETATRSRVATPDTAIAASLMSTLGGGADSVREGNSDVAIVKDRRGADARLVLPHRLGVRQSFLFVPWGVCG